MSSSLETMIKKIKAYLHSKQKLRLQQVMCSIAGFSDLAVE